MTMRYAGLFQVEQLALGVETAAVPAQGSARCDHTMAGHDDGDGIPVVRHAHRAVSMRVADSLGDITVAARLSVGNFEQRMPACQLEVGSAKIERERELAALARKVFVEFLQIGAEREVRFLQLSRITV